MKTTMTINKNQRQLLYHFIVTVVFVYIFYNILTMKKTNVVYRYWNTYITNKYCFILYILLSLFILLYDSYTGVLLLVLAIGTFKSAIKEFFTSESFSGDASDIIDPRYNPSPIAVLVAPINGENVSSSSNPETTTPNTLLAGGQIPTKIVDGQVAADLPVPTVIPLQDTLSVENIQSQALGKDERFKVDEVAVREILRQIKSQVDFDPYKTQLDKDVIYEIYNKYFDNDIFKKLQNNNDDSASYIAAGNFNYVPRVDKVDYDLVTYQNLSNNISFGISPLADGLANKTKLNRT